MEDNRHGEAVARMWSQRWLWIVILLLLGNCFGVVMLVVAATGDPSHQVVPDYYGKGLAWDAHIAQERANRRLGWRARLAAEQVGHRDVFLLVWLLDHDGHPIRQARIDLLAFYKARAAQVLRTTLHERADGSYVAHLAIVRAGLWEVRLRAIRGNNRFTHTFERDISLRPVARAGEGAFR